MTFQGIRNTYLLLLGLNTLAASFIWGINTIFLLDAGLNNTQAFSANAFFTMGSMLFEIPSGILADMWGRKRVYLLGTLTLALTTSYYVWLWHLHATFWQWALASLFLGLGFTFFSGPLVAWMVDALTALKLKDKIESVFAKAQIVIGAATLLGSVSGGLLAQYVNLGFPYVIRIFVFLTAAVFVLIRMKEIGFSPHRTKQIIPAVKAMWINAIKIGFGKAPVRWMIFAAPFTSTALFYIYYATQPYLLKLYGNEKAYSIAGLAAALMAASQIAGGIVSPHTRKLFSRRTAAIFFGVFLGSLFILLMGLIPFFWLFTFLIILFGFTFSAIFPVRQMYLNGLIPSGRRATLLSIDSLMGSSGSVVFQPLLGKTADLWGYPASYLAVSLIQFFALPFIALAYREKALSDLYNGT